MRWRFKIILTVCVVASATVLFMFSPYFYIAEITVNGNDSIEQTEILTRTGIQRTTNMFLFNESEARKRIIENLYIDNVQFTKSLPNKLTITIRERHLSGYVEYMPGKYLYIDEYGRVLEINSFFAERLPVVGGLKFDKFQLGETLEVEDTAAFKTVVTYARLLIKHDLTEQVSRLDVSDGGNTRIFMYHIEFNVGDGLNADEKIRTMKDIADKLPNADKIKGSVDLREIRSQYVLKILV